MRHEYFAGSTGAPYAHSQGSATLEPFEDPNRPDIKDRDRPPMRALPFEAYLIHGESSGIRWSPHRENVLRALWNANRPMGAYEIAHVLGTSRGPKHPTVIYRCLHAFQHARLVLPIITWKRFVISPDPSTVCWGLLLCKSCRSHLPVDLTTQVVGLNTRLAERGFIPRDVSAEVEGVCRACQVH